MIEIIERSTIKYDLALLEKIAKRVADQTIELLIVDSHEMIQLNKNYFNKDYPTDVLSFPLEPTPGAPLGSIVINADKVLEGAQKYGHTPQEEFALLFIHGLLHLLGYDHETDSGQMRQKEAELIKEFNLPESLIVRTEK